MRNGLGRQPFCASTQGCSKEAQAGQIVIVNGLSYVDTPHGHFCSAMRFRYGQDRSERPVTRPVDVSEIDICTEFDTRKRHELEATEIT